MAVGRARGGLHGSWATVVLQPVPSSCFPLQRSKPYITLLFSCPELFLTDFLEKYSTKEEKRIY